MPKSVYDAFAELIGLQIGHINRVKVLTQKEANEYKKSILAHGEALTELDSEKTLAALAKLVDADNNTVAENQEIGNRMRVAFNVLNNLMIFFNDFVPVTEGRVPLEEDLARVILTNRSWNHDNYIATPIMGYSSPSDYFKYLGKYFPTVKFDYTRTIDWMLANAKTAEDVNGIKKIVSIPSVQLNKEQQAQYDVLFEKFRPVLEALENGFETKPGEDGSGMIIVKYTGPGGNIVIPEGTVSFDGKVFRGKSNLTSVKIPDGVTSIGKMFFVIVII
ncbi:hypothetical protein FACS1894190_08340 [Spirochaetia bacterium]|nr:hypothetical protein FACS1894190_08340 [Spirochaetia bacterium]